MVSGALVSNSHLRELQARKTNQVVNGRIYHTVTPLYPRLVVGHRILNPVALQLQAQDTG